jgi:hypothetical protein
MIDVVIKIVTIIVLLNMLVGICLFFYFIATAPLIPDEEEI